MQLFNCVGLTQTDNEMWKTNNNDIAIKRIDRQTSDEYSVESESIEQHDNNDTQATTDSWPWDPVFFEDSNEASNENSDTEQPHRVQAEIITPGELILDVDNANSRLKRNLDDNIVISLKVRHLLLFSVKMFPANQPSQSDATEEADKHVNGLRKMIELYLR
jgi:hypothetical protein